jgi:hypothetical protein
MTDAELHPSTFALDVFFADGARPDEQITAHARICERCARYLEELRRLDAVPLARPPATAVEGVRPRSSAWRWRATAGGALLAAAAVVFGIAMPRSPETPYLGIKGSPAVQVWVHRGQTTLWDGHSPIRTGDAIALNVVCGGFSQITVASVETKTAHLTRLFDGACPPGEQPLPFTLVADAEPGAEHVSVVLRRAPLDDRALAIAVRDTQRSAEVWAFSLTFAKSGI